MGNQRSKKDILVLKSLAEYRILSVRQMAALHFSSLQMARRKRRELEEKGLIEIIHRGFGKSGGRPEGLIYITKGGIARLQKERIL